MPIRHVVVFTFHEGTTEAQVAEMARRLRELPGLIPEIGAYQVGPDATGSAGTPGGNWEFAVTGEFDSLDAFRAYVDHPAHQAVVHDVIAPIRAERASVQFEI